MMRGKSAERAEKCPGDASSQFDLSHRLSASPSPDDEVKKSRPIVRTRLAQAGIRLTWLLNIAAR